MKDFEQQFNAYYSQHVLPEQKIARILAQAEYVRPSFFARPSFSISVVTAALVLVGVVLFWERIPPQIPQLPDFTQAIAQTIVSSHQEGLVLEVQTDRYETLQSQLPRLKFSAFPAQPFLREQFELLGGRYCYLVGQLSVQLRLQDRHSGATYTLYITSLTPQFQPIALEKSLYLNGTFVKIWKEDDRVFGLAGEIPTPALSSKS